MEGAGADSNVWGSGIRTHIHQVMKKSVRSSSIARGKSGSGGSSGVNLF